MHQARNLLMEMGDHLGQFRFVIRDRDTKFTAVYDAAVAAGGIAALRPHQRAPRANASAERWVGTIRRELLDWMLIFGYWQLRSVLAENADHDDGHRRTAPWGGHHRSGLPTHLPSYRPGGLCGGIDSAD